MEAAGDLARRAQIDFKVQVQEWKDTLIRGGDTELFNKHLKGFNERSTAVKEDLSNLAPMLDKLGLPAALANDLVAEHAELDRRYMEALKLYDGSKLTSTLEVDKAVRGMDRAPTEHFADIVKKIQQQGDSLDDAAMAAADKTKTALLSGLLALAIVTIVVSTAWGTMTIGTIVRRLRRATEVARTVASGDLTTQIDVGRPDELGQLLASLRDMNGSLAGIVDRVRESAEKVTVASSQIAAGNMDLSSRTEEQASNLEETAASIEEMTATVGQNAQTRRPGQRARRLREGSRPAGRPRRGRGREDHGRHPGELAQDLRHHRRDRLDRVPDEHPRVERRGGSGARRRAGPRLRGRRSRSAQPRAALRRRGARDQGPHHRIRAARRTTARSSPAARARR